MSQGEGMGVYTFTISDNLLPRFDCRTIEMKSEDINITSAVITAYAAVIQAQRKNIKIYWTLHRLIQPKSSTKASSHTFFNFRHNLASKC